jgi:hypothetical protein
MVGMQVTLALVEPLSQLGQHLFYGRRSQCELPEILHQVRLPAAVRTPPLITNEAKNPQSPMVGVIAAGCRSTSIFILLLRNGLLVGRAVPGFAKCSASGLATRAKGKITTHGPLSCLMEATHLGIRKKSDTIETMIPMRPTTPTAIAHRAETPVESLRAAHRRKLKAIRSAFESLAILTTDSTSTNVATTIMRKRKSGPRFDRLRLCLPSMTRWLSTVKAAANSSAKLMLRPPDQHSKCKRHCQICPAFTASLPT